MPERKPASYLEHAGIPATAALMAGANRSTLATVAGLGVLVKYHRDKDYKKKVDAEKFKRLNSLGLRKSAALAPFKVKDPEELASFGGFSKEFTNRAIGTGAGLALGAVLGKLVGRGVGMISPASKRLSSYYGPVLGMAVGGGLGDYGSLKKTEIEANLSKDKRVTGGKYFAREVASLLGSPIPVLGNAAGDYIVSRKIQDNY